MKPLSRNFYHVKVKRQCFVPALIVLATIFGSATSRAEPISKTQNVRIMSVGDSITEGKSYGQGGYRRYLQSLLSAGGYTYTFVGKEDSLNPNIPANNTTFSAGMSQPNHEGYGSYRIDQIADGIPLTSPSPEGQYALPVEQTIDNNNPDVILLMIGTNDCLQQYNPAAQPGTDFATKASVRLSNLLSRIFAKKPGVMVVVAQITPVNSASIEANFIKPYNNLVPGIVSQLKAAGRNIVMVNQHAAFDPAVDTSDNIHPTANGFQKMASVWYGGLTKNSASPTTGAALSYTGVNFNQNGTHFSLGFTFTTGGQSVVVTKLGYINDGKNNTHQVQIYQVNTPPNSSGGGTGTPVPGATASVTTTGSDTATFTFAPIAPVTLEPNTTYQIVANNNGNGFFTNAVNPVYNGIYFGSSTYTANTDSPSFNTTTYSPNDMGNFGPNFWIAGKEALTYTSGNFNPADATYHFSLGYTFTTGPTVVTVSQLGYINDGKNNTHQVRIYQVNTPPSSSGGGTGTLVPGATASVTTNGSNTSTFTYVPITPVNLAANTTYQIVANNNANGFLTNAVNPVYNNISYGTSTYMMGTDSPDFNAFTHSPNDVGNFGPNFIITGY